MGYLGVGYPTVSCRHHSVTQAQSRPWSHLETQTTRSLLVTHSPLTMPGPAPPLTSPSTLRLPTLRPPPRRRPQTAPGARTQRSGRTAGILRTGSRSG